MNNLNKNLKTIRKHIPLFADHLEQTKPVNWISSVNSESNQLNIAIRTDYGQKLIYDNQTPDAKAIAEVNTLDLHQDAVTVVIGSGAGYFINELLRKCHKKHHVIIVEPILDFLKISLEQFDFSKAIANKQLLFAVTLDDVAFHLHSFENIKPVEHFYLLTESYINLRPEYHDFIDYTKQIINQIQCNIGTVIGAGEIIAFNDIDSLPYAIRHRGINELRNLFKGKPAISIATGPGVEKNIHLLLDDEVREKFIIIAVGQALRMLLAYGIKPDFITSVDFGEINMSHYKDLLDCDVPFVALNRSYAPLLRDWQKHKFICASLNPGYENTACGLLYDKGMVEQGGSVIHLSFGVAQMLGCDPIILIGHDLSYENIEHSHTKQADTAGNLKIENGLIKWDVDDPSSIIKDDQQIIGEAQYIQGYWGKSVLTNGGFLAFILNFARMFKVSQQTIINSTEGGAKLKHTRQMLLKDALKKYGKNDIDKTVIEPLLSLCDNSDELIKESVKRLKTDITGLSKIIEACEKALKYCKRLKYDKSKTILDKQHEWTHKAEMLCKQNNLISLAIYGTRRIIGQRHLLGDVTNLDLLKDENKDKFELRVQRTQLILGRAEHAARQFKEKFKTALKVLKGYPESLEVKPEPLPSVDQCQEYLEAGNFANPLLKIAKIFKEKRKDPINESAYTKHWSIRQKALSLKNDTITEANSAYIANYPQNKRLLKYNQLLEDAQESGREKRQFKRALKLLKQAVAMSGIKDKTLALWGVASASGQSGGIDESITAYNQLITDYPQNVTYKFELMQVLLSDERLNDAIREFQKIVELTGRYDYFYKIFARIYFNRKMWQNSFDCISEYLLKFSFDIQALELKQSLIVRLNRCYELPIIQKQINNLKWKIK